jgi:molybdate transport system ATP-binding protein
VSTTVTGAAPVGAGLSVDATIDRGGFTVSVDFEVPAGGSMAVLGPNGAGKSTLLGGLAGLTPLRSGRVELGGVTLESAGGVRLRPEHRRVALLDQKPRLFPHLSIAQNIAFGPRSLGDSRAQARRTAQQWLDRIGLADRAGHRPEQLSGGQQQRVAIARAFAARPRVLLLDEPLAALDAESAPLVRRMLAAELSRTGTTSVVVTHELSDAWQWAEHCVVLAGGRVIERAAPAELAARPRHPFTASLAGFGVLRGTWTGIGLRVGEAVLPGTVDLCADLAPGSPAFGVVAPRDVTVAPVSPGEGGGGVIAMLTAVTARAGTVRLETDTGLAAELDFAEAMRLGSGRLPAMGESYALTPHGMRVVGELRR